jgi:hypothetical protein
MAGLPHHIIGKCKVEHSWRNKQSRIVSLQVRTCTYILIDMKWMVSFMMKPSQCCLKGCCGIYTTTVQALVHTVCHEPTFWQLGISQRVRL